MPGPQMPRYIEGVAMHGKSRRNLYNQNVHPEPKKVILHEL